MTTPTSPPTSLTTPPTQHATITPLITGGFAPDTFVEVTEAGRIDIARVDNGEVVDTLPKPSLPPNMRVNEATRAANGDLVVNVFPVSGNDAYWLDTKTGIKFVGGSARLSPDGTRLAALVSDPPTRRTLIRQYDLASGEILSSLVAVESGDNYGYVEGFDWTPDGRSYVIAMAPGSAKGGGLFVTASNAHELPARPAVATLLANSNPIAYSNPVVLANGHVVAFEYSFPDQHGGWPGAIVDIDLHTGVVRPIAGDPRIFTTDSTPYCADLPRSTTAASPKFDSCYFFLGFRSDAVANSALLLDGNSNTWLYDGSTVRVVARHVTVSW